MAFGQKRNRQVEAERLHTCRPTESPRNACLKAVGAGPLSWNFSISQRVLPTCTLWLMRSHLIFFVYDFFPCFHFPRIKTRPPSKNSRAKGFYIFKDFDIYSILFSRTFLPIDKCVYISMTDCTGPHQYLALLNLEIVASGLGKKSLVPVLILFA